MSIFVNLPKIYRMIPIKTRVFSFFFNYWVIRAYFWSGCWWCPLLVTRSWLTWLTLITWIRLTRPIVLFSSYQCRNHIECLAYLYWMGGHQIPYFCAFPRRCRLIFLPLQVFELCCVNCTDYSNFCVPPMEENDVVSALAFLLSVSSSNGWERRK